jgi:AGZA family xanthine/uracil permease-like MFS transporter
MSDSPQRTPRWFVRGDVDGFFGLALDNLIQLLLIDALCRFVLGFPNELLYGQVLPGAAVSILAGNIFYSWQAMKLGREQGRDDICALPYGINTPSVFAYVFLVMFPVKLATGDPYMAWQAGLVACLGSGLIELCGAPLAGWLRKNVPRAALLSALAGIALTLISMEFLFRTFASPIVGLSTLTIVCLVYFGRLRFRGGIPGGLVAVVLGTALAWGLGQAPTSDSYLAAQLYLPVPVIGELWAALSGDHLMTYLSVIIPMGLFNLVGSLQNLDSAEAAGDSFPTTPSLAANGAGTIAAALFGSCFPTTIYIGHPGWKALGARIGYSWLDGIFMTVICLTGCLSVVAWAIPIEAGMAIVLWIGIVMGAQAFQATPRRHAPAVIIGMLPVFAAWGAMMVKSSARQTAELAAGISEAKFGDASPLTGLQFRVFTGDLGDALDGAQLFHEGLFALEQGVLFTSLILAAAMVAIIEGQFSRAGAWLCAGSLLSLVGLMHGWQWTGADTALQIKVGAQPEAALGYAIAAGLCFIAPWVGTREGDGASESTGEEI